MTQSHLFQQAGSGSPRGSSASRARGGVPRAWMMIFLGASSWMLLLSLGWALVAAWSIVHRAILG